MVFWVVKNAVCPVFLAIVGYWNGEINMHSIIIEHVAITELPEAWRNRLPIGQEARVRVVIEEENAPASSSEDAGAFGMWRDRDDMADTEGYVRNLRASRFERD